MQSQKTHARHLRIVEKQEDSGNAGGDFDVRSDFARNQAVRDAGAEGMPPKGVLRELARDRGLIRGPNQLSQHRKRSGN